MVLPHVESSVSKACTAGGPSSWKKLPQKDYVFTRQRPVSKDKEDNFL